MNDLLKQTVAELLCVLLLGGCAGKSTTPSLTDEIEPDACTVQEIRALSARTDELTVWSTYWDGANDMDELKETATEVDAVSLFAAYFQDGKVAIPEASTRMLGKLRRREATAEKTVYLSVVNDVTENGKNIQKDTEILWKVLGTEEAAQNHAEELVKLAADNGFDGIEIDYEKIRKDMDLWAAFLNFEEKLLALADEAGLKVRIVLEPSTPVEQLDFPEGADYVVMCYNLCGGGTDPGPKADNAFLAQLYEKFHALPGISYALANGGYLWETGTQSAVQCRAAEAKALAEKTGATPARDPASGALYFSCTDGQKQYTVWYADDETLVQWADQLSALAGGNVSVSLWRI